MACDAHAKSVLQTRYLSVVGQRLADRGGLGKSESSRTIAEYVESVLYGCNFSTGCQELLRAILYGFHTCEIMWTYSEGTVGIDKLVGKHPRRFIFTPERELRLLTPAGMVEGEEVPERKFIVFTYGDSDNPLWRRAWARRCGGRCGLKSTGSSTGSCSPKNSAAPLLWANIRPVPTRGDQDNLLQCHRGDSAGNRHYRAGRHDGWICLKRPGKAQ